MSTHIASGRRRLNAELIIAQAQLASKVAKAEKYGMGVTLTIDEVQTLTYMLRLLASGAKKDG